MSGWVLVRVAWGNNQATVHNDGDFLTHALRVSLGVKSIESYRSKRKKKLVTRTWGFPWARCGDGTHHFHSHGV